MCRDSGRSMASGSPSLDVMGGALRFNHTLILTITLSLNTTGSSYTQL